MIQNIGGFLVLSWLWANRTKEPEVVIPTEEYEFFPEAVVTTRKPFVPAVTPIPLVEEETIYTPPPKALEDDPCANLTPGSPAWISCKTTYGDVSPEPSNGLPVCPPVEVRLDLTTADTINYNPTLSPCGCPPGFRKVEVRRGGSTATRCYNGV